jgi:hypothetical protein
MRIAAIGEGIPFFRPRPIRRHVGNGAERTVGTGATQSQPTLLPRTSGQTVGK